MLIEEQIAQRRLRAGKEAFKIEAQGRGVFGDYQVFSPASKRVYRVALRGVGLFDNYCACPDYAVNTLGTCKHIEAVLLQSRSPFGGAGVRLLNLDNVRKDARLAKLVENRNLRATSIEEETKTERQK